ncbi:hypothetical protein FA15DRAFT_675050 [Coprinopsis marcescibilis]|uniref:Uncharacterized protein n=1 Tax=Coprinopsis marcescibilis TaxID=230819 RepID=A0A5C3KFF4_COPMA|nr:hypothetical protein FA15DRAFT_675050 [Coprinopsis marcescibilis]
MPPKPSPTSKTPSTQARIPKPVGSNSTGPARNTGAPGAPSSVSGTGRPVPIPSASGAAVKSTKAKKK